MFDVLDFGKYNLYIWLSYSISFTSILIYFIIINARYKKASNLLKSLKNKKKVYLWEDIFFTPVFLVQLIKIINFRMLYIY